ncbi:MAG TPA: IPT/TIG domain-containing protein [Solirubrobacteraceae bacterium]|nr:IPT/TIG domain-containing protein [Solirubrobacteraceae bacterium]
MTGSQRGRGFIGAGRAARVLARGRSHGAGSRLALVAALALVAMAVCAASASAVECYGEGCDGSSYEYLTAYPGSVMPSTTTYFVYWDPKSAPHPFPEGYESGITTYFKGLAAENGSDQNQYSVLTQYEVKYETHFGKALTDKDPYPAEDAECAHSPTTPCVGSGQLEAELASLVKAHKLPSEFNTDYLPGEEPEARIAYFVLLPPGVTECDSGEGSFGALGCSGVNWCAYHDHANYNFREGAHGGFEDVEGGEVLAVIPYNVGVRGCDSGQHPNGISDGALSGGMVHEFSEMITNPLGNGWTAPQIEEYQEVADMCEGRPWAGGNEAFKEKMMYGTPLGTAPNGALYNEVVDGREYYYQQLWSNEAGGCRQRRALPPIVTKLAPAKGSVAGGKKVKVTGLNFENPTATSVHFGKLPAKEFAVTSLRSITAVAPAAESAGPVEVTVTTSAGTSASTAADTFTYTAK